MSKTGQVRLVDQLPPGKIEAFPEWGDPKEDDWVIGVRHGPGRSHYTLIATCPTERFAKALAKLFDAMPRK